MLDHAPLPILILVDHFCMMDISSQESHQIASYFSVNAVLERSEFGILYNASDFMAQRSEPRSTVSYYQVPLGCGCWEET